MFNRLSASFKRAILVLTGATVVIIGYDMARGQENLDSYKYSRDAQQGKQISPVRVNLMDKNPDLVYLGSYLVNGQGGCNSCHTCPSYRGNNPFKSGGAGLGAGRPAPVNAANYLAGGTTFPGRGAPATGAVLTAPNLTPDGSGLPGGMTYDEFKNAMQNGMVSSKPGHVLQVMPWPVFRNLYENDLVAIYQYLSAIPSAQPGGVCTNPGQTAPWENPIHCGNLALFAHGNRRRATTVALMGDTSEASYCNGQIDRAAFGNGCAGPIASSFSYTTVTVPGITGAQFTGINNIGQISGYGGAGEVKTGLILNSNGTVSTVYQPDSTGTKALPGCHS